MKKITIIFIVLLVAFNIIFGAYVGWKLEQDKILIDRLEKEKLEILSEVWDFCNSLESTEQQSCYDYYGIDFPYQLDKEKYLARYMKYELSFKVPDEYNMSRFNYLLGFFDLIIWFSINIIILSIIFKDKIEGKTKEE